LLAFAGLAEDMSFWKRRRLVYREL
jgi:hypothetical protein